MNCIIISFFNNFANVKYALLLLESLFIFGNLNDNIDIIIYTSNKFKQKIIDGFLYNSKIKAKERRENAMEALKMVGLSDRWKHYPNQLSGGQQQRVAIARALVNDPVIILADEATGNLDTRTSYEIMSLFQQLNSKGRTIAFVTHEPDIALFSQRSIMLRDGRIIRDEKKERPASAAESLAALPKEEDELVGS